MNTTYCEWPAHSDHPIDPLIQLIVIHFKHMGMRYFRDYNDSPMYKKNQDQDLLRNGWRPLYRDLDPEFLWECRTTPGK